MSSWFDAQLPAFIATVAFGPWAGDRWIDYVNWSGLSQLDELVSLDSMTCPHVINEIKDTYWPNIVNEDFMTDYFVDVEFLIKETAAVENKNILCVFRNPPAEPVMQPCDHCFEFLGFDLVDTMGSASALSNCGGFPDVFLNEELSRKGLIKSRQRAFEIQATLRSHHPNQSHADCHVWAIFRLQSTAGRARSI